MRTIREVKAALTEGGFRFLRAKGSHETWGHEDGRRVTVPSRSTESNRWGNLLSNVRRVLAGGVVTRAGAKR